MHDDPIIQEIHLWRQEYLARFNYDSVAIYEDMLKREAVSKQPKAALKPKKGFFSDENLSVLPPELRQLHEKSHAQRAF